MLVDANILLYASNTEDPHHVAAKQWLEAMLNGNRWVGLPWQSRYAPAPQRVMSASRLLVLSTNHPAT